MTSCSIKDCADESTCNAPTGKRSAFNSTSIYKWDLYGSITPLMTDWIRILIFYPGQKVPPEANGSISHYLKEEKKPFGLMLL
jgi:hypothetical protein